MIQRHVRSRESNFKYLATHRFHFNGSRCAKASCLVSPSRYGHHYGYSCKDSLVFERLGRCLELPCRASNHPYFLRQVCPMILCMWRPSEIAGIFQCASRNCIFLGSHWNHSRIWCIGSFNVIVHGCIHLLGVWSSTINHRWSHRCVCNRKLLRYLH